MNKYTIRKDENYGSVLVKNGLDSFCPFQAPMPIPQQTSMGTMSLSIMRMPCSSQCPHAVVVHNEKDDISYYFTECTGKISEFPLIDTKESTPILKLV